MKSLFDALKKFLGPTNESYPDVLTASDVARVITSTHVVAYLPAIAILVLQALGVVAQNTLGPVLGHVAFWCLGMIIEQVRRLPQYDPKILDEIDGASPDKTTIATK